MDPVLVYMGLKIRYEMHNAFVNIICASNSIFVEREYHVTEIIIIEVK